MYTTQKIQNWGMANDLNANELSIYNIFPHMRIHDRMRVHVRVHVLEGPIDTCYSSWLQAQIISHTARTIAYARA